MDYKCLLNGSGLESLDAQFFENISQAFMVEQSLLQVSSDHLAESYRARLAVLAVNARNNPIGYTRLLPLLTALHADGAWFELGSTWVHPDYLGAGINQAMYQLLLPAHKDKNILATTTNLFSLAVGQRLGLVTVPRKALPSEVWLSSCICPASKTKSDSPENCKLAWDEPQQACGPCWFRITRETAQRLELRSWMV